GKTYVLHEITSPAGYGVAGDIVFTINEDGSITTSARTSDSGNGMTLIMEDPIISVYISKEELGTTTELSGASLAISDSTGIIEEWQTNGQSHKITAALKVGEVYTLEETKAPAGYYTAEPVTFTILSNGTLQITKDSSAKSSAMSYPSEYGTSVVKNFLTMYDRPIRVEISKKRLTGGDDDYVEGAELALYGKDDSGEYNTLIYTWTSPASGAVLVPYGKLEVGESYKVVETSVPAGYVKAADVIFTVKDYDEFTQTDEDGNVTQEEVVLDGMTSVIISKQSVSDTEELAGAELKVTDEDGNEIASWTSGTKPVLLSTLASESELSAEEKTNYSGYTIIYGVSLEAGETYTLTEVTAPDGYAVAQSVEFTVSEEGTTSPSPVVMKDAPLEIQLSKKDLTTQDNLSGAELQLLDKDGSVLHEWTSGEKPVLFTQRTLSASEAAAYDEVVKLVLIETKDETDPYTYTLHEVSAPTGYATADDITFTIKGTDVQQEDGSIREESMYDPRDGEVSLSGTKTWIIPKDAEGNPLANYTYPTVTIELYRDSTTQGVMDTTAYKSIDLTNGEENYTFGPLEKYKYKDAGIDYEYTYTVKEVMSTAAAKQFTSEEVEDEDGNITGFINRLKQEKTSLSGEKVWILCRDEDGNIDTSQDYADVNVYLLRDGSRVDADGDGTVDYVTIKNGAVSTDGTESFSFSDLDKYDLDTGREYTYTVEEVGDGSTVFDNDITYREHECQILNVPFHDPFSISGKKLWIDPVGSERPDVTIELYRDGKLFKTTKLNADNTFDFGDLYEYNLGWSDDEDDNKATADGHKFVYELKETGATGYSFEVDFNGEIRTLTSGEQVSEATVTNTITQEYVEISGTKYWDDAGDSSSRPTATINLYATDTAGRSHTLVDTYYLSNSSTTYSFGTTGRVKLPKYDTNGQVITYTVEEEALSGYVSSQSGYDFTNTPSKVRISKVDATTGDELAGAYMKLTRVSTGTVVDSWTSTTTAHYIEGLVMGESYTLSESLAPLGYEIASSVTFTVRTDGVEQTVTMYDEPITGTVTLTKRDTTTRALLTGAVFNLYTSSGTLVRATGSAGSYTYSTSGTTSLAVSSSGTLSVYGLPYGSYYFKEITAPSGYTLSTATESFTIGEADASVSVTFLDTRSTGAVGLIKTNLGGTTALSGAVFELYSRTPRTVGQAA
ncbi:MAG TPA: SpaA isopeptide-forming pilin-related protein, partial [Lachnospiraceae bacterium]|nr:SpaA isopeptide-forming pilin-related protein [Lachnospiraceae bacterium]